MSEQIPAVFMCVVAGFAIFMVSVPYSLFTQWPEPKRLAPSDQESSS